MNIREAIKQQRVKHIVSSYQLDGDSSHEAFAAYLAELLSQYPAPLIELALVETLVDNWLNFPMPRGCRFLTQVHDRLKAWEHCTDPCCESAQTAIASTITPEQFQQITGLDPSPIFGPSGSPPAYTGDSAASV